ncbi:hypothetical protein V9T40_011958 [Parthenolecanium corni]|uniref:Uncharacterized protein n=1 Tax=Parthenolecanium corni TaxID=536013 RepID=A0AAN9XYW4_9HEMI
MANVHFGFQKILFKRFSYIILWHVGIVTFTLRLVASINTLEDFFTLSWIKNLFVSNTLAVALFQLFLSAVFIVTESKQYLRVEHRIDFLINIDSIDKDVPFTLKEALATHNVPLLQYLGFYDLNIISQFDGARRKQIFSLSYPGGHPHVWKSISQEAVKLILETNSQLEAITLPPKPKPPEMAAKYSTADEVYFKMRSLSQSHFLQEKMPAENYVDISSKIANFLKTIRPVSFMLEELKEKQLVSALQHYQALSLACYSMANLASASMAEDRFGIVQQDLSVIINALLKLYVTLNKLVVVVNRKPNSSILQIKKHLVHVVKSSLYKLAIDFGPYVKDLSLPAEDEKLFTNFILFKN